MKAGQTFVQRPGNLQNIIKSGLLHGGVEIEYGKIGGVIRGGTLLR